MATKKNKPKRPNAMVIVERTKKRIFRYVPERYIPSNSFGKDYQDNRSNFLVGVIRNFILGAPKQDGRLHILGLDLTSKFWALENPAVVDKEAPTDFYVAKHCADEVEEVYGLSMPMSEKIKIGILVGLCIGILIVIFLIAMASGGA